MRSGTDTRTAAPPTPWLRRAWHRLPSAVRRRLIALVGEQRARQLLLRRGGIRDEAAFVTASVGGPQAIDRAMARLEVTGDYYEFGLYRGYTFWYAQHSADRHGRAAMRLFGFDSFEGLPEVSGPDREAGLLFFSGDYRCGREQVESHLTEHGFDWSRAVLVEGYFDRSLTPEIKIEHSMGPAALVMIDCDLYQSTVPVLDFLADRLQAGTIILFDDWRSFGGTEERGEPRAFREFLEAHTEWRATPIFDFGTDGRAFSVQPASAEIIGSERPGVRGTGAPSPA